MQLCKAGQNIGTNSLNYYFPLNIVNILYHVLVPLVNNCIKALATVCATVFVYFQPSNKNKEPQKIEISYYSLLLRCQSLEHKHHITRRNRIAYYLFPATNTSFPITLT